MTNENTINFCNNFYNNLSTNAGQRLTFGFDTIKQEQAEATGVFRIAYSPPTATCKKGASLQAENIRMQNLREVGQTILLCEQLREVGASSDSDDQAIKDLMAFCQ